MNPPAPASEAPSPSIAVLLDEYERALRYTDELWRDLDDEQIMWRPTENSSAIGWHLGHQAAVAHFMVRNLTAAEPSPDPDKVLSLELAAAEALLRGPELLNQVERVTGPLLQASRPDCTGDDGR